MPEPFSRWARWDPHIHAPGTALNDQFGHDWDWYFAAIESARPKVVALGITDYWSLNSYEEFVERRGARCEDLALVFPNIEMRVAPATTKGHAINLHLLISPEERDHVQQTKRLLRLLTCEVRDGNNIQCDWEGLVELGWLHLGDSAASVEKAYRVGVGQFKVDASAVFDWYERNAWLRKNALLVISGGNDGLSGLRRDSGFREKHDLFVRKTHLIFSATPSDIAYYDGSEPSVRAELLDLYGGPRACLHGCDAHAVSEVLCPDEDRYCWIKAAPTFDGLRQVIYEPVERVSIGREAPAHPDPDRVIQRVRILDHDDWFDTDDLSLAPGLTAIIGEKGTGKTALADLIAAGTGSWSGADGSFLQKALGELRKASVEITWVSGETTVAPIAEVGSDLSGRTKYLSQQFVERLCSGDVLATELLEEVERVIFDHLAEADRLNCSSFSELRKKQTALLKDARESIRASLAELSQRVEEIVSASTQVPEKEKKLAAGQTEIQRVENLLKILLSAADQKAAKRVAGLEKELAELEENAATLKERLAKLSGLAKQVETDMQQFDLDHVDLQPALRSAGIPHGEWPAFKKQFAGDPTKSIDAAKARIEKELSKVSGSKSDPDEVRTITRVRKLLEAERKTLSLDQQRTVKIRRLQKDQARRKSEAAGLKKEIEEARQALTEELPSVQERRMEAYLKYFDLIQEERAVLEALYGPLEEELAQRETGERDLSFEVHTSVDVDAWAAQGEEMLDLRRVGPYTKRGALEREARLKLMEPWRTGDRAAIKAGIEEIITGVREGGIGSKLRTGFTARHIADWIFSVDHIQLDYTLRYRGTPLRYLSPGTRGIVLLILYLAVDRLDDRPLIVDQPEENLDNASVYDVLVHYVREAKQRRQIIVVTHNPNLVVNTDAEQVIVAQAIRRTSGLPRITYRDGPLEAVPREGKQIREHVCEVLEGGRTAFLNRERRYALERADEAEGP